MEKKNFILSCVLNFISRSIHFSFSHFGVNQLELTAYRDSKFALLRSCAIQLRSDTHTSQAQRTRYIQCNVCLRVGAAKKLNVCICVMCISIFVWRTSSVQPKVFVFVFILRFTFVRQSLSLSLSAGRSLPLVTPTSKNDGAFRFSFLSFFFYFLLFAESEI